MQAITQPQHLCMQAIYLFIMIQFERKKNYFCVTDRVTYIYVTTFNIKNEIDNKYLNRGIRPKLMGFC